MKRFFVKIIMLLFFMGWLAFPGRSQSPTDSLMVQSPGFVDKNHDGINDLFHDANGDGKNDVNQQVYRHKFQFVDEDKDGLNDLWQDRDGDGVNDLMVIRLQKRGIRAKTQWFDRDGDGILDADARSTFDADLREFVLDMDEDGKNDITGLECKKNNTWGFRYGTMDEEQNEQVKNFIDKNKDGMHDSFTERFQKKWGKRPRKHDYFIDRDGDGIADDRGFGGLKGQRGRKRGGGKKRGH